MPNLHTLNLTDLRAAARDADIPGFSRMNREQLLRALEVAEHVDGEIAHYRHEHRRWSTRALHGLGDGKWAGLQRVARTLASTGSLLVAESALGLVGRIGGTPVSGQGFRIQRLIEQERRLAQNLLRQPLSALRHTLEHHHRHHHERVGHHDRSWLHAAAAGDAKARRRMISEELAGDTP